MSIELINCNECCKDIKNHVKPLVFEKLILACIKMIAFHFEVLHGFPYVLVAIDKSYIFIIAHFWDSASYYCGTEFLFNIALGIVDVYCNFWDYYFNWVGHIHD